MRVVVGVLCRCAADAGGLAGRGASKVGSFAWSLVLGLELVDLVLDLCQGLVSLVEWRGCRKRPSPLDRGIARKFSNLRFGGGQKDLLVSWC